MMMMMMMMMMIVYLLKDVDVRTFSEIVLR
jgi:hypothetical protein